jgi:hypothetical protein
MQTLVVLPLNEPKCIARSCMRSAACARHQVPYTKGRPMEDCSASVNWFPAGCHSFVSLSQAVAEPPARRVHKPIGEEA